MIISPIDDKAIHLLYCFVIFCDFFYRKIFRYKPFSRCLYLYNRSEKRKKQLAIEKHGGLAYNGCILTYGDLL